MDINRFVDVLLPEMDDPNARKALIQAALYGSTVLQKIRWEGAALDFTRHLVITLYTHGKIESGQLALAVLLEAVYEQVGEDRKPPIQALIDALTNPPAVQPITPPTEQITGKLYVFISYARPDESVAEKVETFLTAAGVRVFRDTSQIREGANWDIVIENALRECDRMVLLLSTSSMPYRKEVHREWFYFDQKRKPLYPLYLEDCDLHSRMNAYNYIDVRHNLQAGLERLLKALRADFIQPNEATGADRVGVFDDANVEARTLPEALQALYDAVRSPEGSVVLSVEQATAIKDHKPENLQEYRLGRIAEWTLPRYALDNRFVNLTLLLDKGEDAQQRWQHAENMRFNDMQVMLDKVPDAVMVLLGAPGSGKSTLLRRLQLDHSIDRLRDDADQISFFIQLNRYRARTDGTLPSPEAWLAERWETLYPQLPPLADYLRAGRVLFLLDALNEMPHKNTEEYYHRVELWRDFAQDAAHAGNRLVFSCRSLDYSATLSSPEIRVPQVEVQPMSAEQVRDFLRAYLPSQEAMVWEELDGSPQFDLFRTPYFLKLLCEQVEISRSVPKGRASLFAGFIRQVLNREIQHHPLLRVDTLLTERDHQKLIQGRWRTPFELPERGVLIPRLSLLAFAMQQAGLSTESKQVRIQYDDACDLIDHERDEDIIKAGVSLNVLDEDISQQDVAFFHQLLQEFFAARQLAENPNPALVHVEWHVDQVSPTLDAVLATLADGDPLPPLDQTGWEETTLTAAPMAKDPNAFIRALMPHNLPLAALCAASAEVTIDPDLKREIQQALIARLQDFTHADLRARIAAGLALGDLGDPRFERKTGAHGDYLLPPMVTIPAGTYPMGDDSSQYDFEKPAHTVDLAAFEIVQFPVTNAEYALFMAGGGYEDEQWWETDNAKAWLRGESSTDGQKETWRENKKLFESWSEDFIRGLVTQNRITSEEANDYIIVKNWSKNRLEEWLDETFPTGKVYRQPEFWDDTRFNNPVQPVVGVTWFEARAYCKWLSAQTGQQFDLSTEAQFEAAARGKNGRLYPYGAAFDVTRSNTFESHIRRTTPIGIFDNATPEGAVDLSGNAYTWTTSIYDQEAFPYPYKAEDGRENISSSARRVLRGGSWYDSYDNARAASRNYLGDVRDRSNSVGFRIVRPQRSGT